MKKLIVAMVLAAAANGFASFSYQGALRSADGSAITERNKTIIFRLYESPDANATPLWEGQQSVTISPTNGLFNVEIGDNTPKYNPSEARTPIDEILARQNDLYIGLEISDKVKGLSGEIRPRQRILPVPTAAYARNVTQARDNFEVKGGLIVAGAMNVTSNATFQSNVIVEGDLKLNNNAVLTGDAAVHGKLSVAVGSKQVEVVPVPVGGIIMWSQTGAPDNEVWATGAKDEKGHWAICDGRKIGEVQTPDLRGRFIVGASVDNGKGKDVDKVYKVGETGGTSQVALSKAQMPNHSHLYPNDDSIRDRNVLGKFNDGEHFYNDAKNNFDFSSDGDDKDHIYRTGTAGGDSDDYNKGTDGYAEAHENRPPYYALYYIMRVR